MLFFASLLFAFGGERKPLDGAQVYKDNCGRCHNPRTPADLDHDGWRAVSFHMRVKANLTPREFEALEAFLMPPEPSTVPAFGQPVADAECLRCHDRARVDDAIAAGRDQPTWEATLQRMVLYGAVLTPEEQAELAAWLAAQAP